ncbi:MAG: hypothetical protein ACYDH8_06070 [Syntrophales bacterium]
MRKLATIREVDEIRQIVGADAIELAVLGGWQVGVRKAQEIRPRIPVVAERFSRDGCDHAKLLAYAEGKSLFNPQAEREGVVFRSVDETPSNQGKISFKAISNKYLLKHDG